MSVSDPPDPIAPCAGFGGTVAEWELAPDRGERFVEVLRTVGQRYE